MNYTTTTGFNSSKRGVNKFNSQSLTQSHRHGKKRTKTKQPSQQNLDTYETKPDEEPIDLKIGYANANDDEILDEIFDHTQLKVPLPMSLPSSIDNIETKYNANLDSRRLMKSKLNQFGIQSKDTAEMPNIIHKYDFWKNDKLLDII